MTKTTFFTLICFALIPLEKLNGQCWDTIHVNMIDKPSEDRLPPLAAFPDGTGYYYDLTSSAFYQSLDFGSTWKLKSKIRNYNDTHYNTIRFVNPSRGWAMFRDTMYRTDDGGSTWKFVHDFVDPMIFDIQAPFFDDEQIGWLDYGGNLWGTKDGGVTWKRYTDIYSSLHVGSSSGSKVIIRQGGPYDKQMTLDTGKTWVKVPNPVLQINDVRFIDNKHAYYVVADTFDTKDKRFKGGGFAYSEDGGFNWRKEPKGVFQKYYFGDFNLNIRYADTINGIVLTKKLIDTLNKKVQYAIYRTKDGGKSWREDKVTTVPYEQEIDWYWKMAYPSKDFGLIAARTGTLFRYKTPPPPDCNLVVVVDSLQKDQPIRWYPPAGCVGGYVLKIGTTIGGGEIVDSLDVGDTLQWIPNKAIPFGKDLYVAVRTYNDGGFAPNCNPVVLPTKVCTLTTRLDTTIKFGTPLFDKIYKSDTVLAIALKSVQGCDSIVNLHVDVLTSTTDLPEELVQAISVAPNPTSANLQIAFQLKSPTTGSLSITDRLGRILWKTDRRAWSVGAQSVPIDVSHYPSGVYQVHWRSASGISVVSWVKQD